MPLSPYNLRPLDPAYVDALEAAALRVLSDKRLVFEGGLGSVESGAGEPLAAAAGARHHGLRLARGDLDTDINLRVLKASLDRRRAGEVGSYPPEANE